LGIQSFTIQKKQGINMSNPTLIAGFEDVMTFIKNQDLKIKMLEEEIQLFKRIDSDWEREGKKAIEENKKLKNDLRLCAEGLIPNDLIQRGIVETCREKVMDLNHDIEVLEARNEELEEEVTELKDEIKKLREVESLLQPFENTEGFHMKVVEMKQENKKLKEKEIAEAQETLHHLGVPREKETCHILRMAEFNQTDSEEEEESEEENKKLQKINDQGVSSQWEGKHIRFESDEE